MKITRCSQIVFIGPRRVKAFKPWLVCGSVWHAKLGQVGRRTASR